MRIAFATTPIRKSLRPAIFLLHILLLHDVFAALGDTHLNGKIEQTVSSPFSVLAGNGREYLALSLVFPVALWFQLELGFGLVIMGEVHKSLVRLICFFLRKGFANVVGQTRLALVGVSGMVELFLWSCLAALSYVPTNKLPNKYGNSFSSQLTVGGVGCQRCKVANGQNLKCIS